MTRETLRADLLAGITITAMLSPLSAAHWPTLSFVLAAFAII